MFFRNILQAKNAFTYLSILAIATFSMSAILLVVFSRKMVQLGGLSNSLSYYISPQSPNFVFDDYYTGHHFAIPVENTTECRAEVKEAFQFAYSNYVKYAWGADELRPVSGKAAQVTFGGFGVTIIDSLSTMVLMNLTAELEQAKAFVSQIDFDKNVYVSVFETIIRNLGGLISAYDLTQEPIFLSKAEELAEAFLPSFETRSGLPFAQLNPKLGLGRYLPWASGRALLAEAATFQLEFERLSFLTGKEKYRKLADKVTDLFDKAYVKCPGLFPSYLSTSAWDSMFTSKTFSVGAMSDSYFEYLLKTHLLTNGSNPAYLRLYNSFVISFAKNLVGRTPTEDPIYFSGKIEFGRFSPEQEHLACFMPGLLALGYHALPSRPKWELDLAKALASSCYATYAMTKSGVAGEIVLFPGSVKASSKKISLLSKKFKTSNYLESKMATINSNYHLRPETVESIFLLYRVTKDPMYLDWGWKIFQSIEKYCRTEYAYSSLVGVNSPSPKKKNELPSYFFAETLKYLYLLFSPESVISLEDFVFNTEAHPFKKNARI